MAPWVNALSKPTVDTAWLKACTLCDDPVKIYQLAAGDRHFERALQAVSKTVENNLLPKLFPLQKPFDFEGFEATEADKAGLPLNVD